MIVCITGHRPEDCEEEFVVRDRFRNVFEEAKPEVVIVGMAAGADLWAGCEAILLDIPVWSARPWAGHSPRQGDDEQLYEFVVRNAAWVVDVNSSKSYPGPQVYHKRNEWMVDAATNVLAYWSGKTSGGTYACIQYAKKVGKPVRNIYVP